jgi:hypothetical protein
LTGSAAPTELRKQQAILRRDWEQAQRREQRQRHGKERAALKLRQDFSLQTKLAELQQREKQGREAIDRDLDRQRRADIPATGFRRVFQIATKQDMREAFNRQHRETQRIEAGEQQKADLKAALQAERNQFVRGQVEDRERLAERHRGEDQQMQQAVEQRKSLDRTAEVHARTNDTRSNSRQHEREDDREQSRGRSIGREIPPP